MVRELRSRPFLNRTSSHLSVRQPDEKAKTGINATWKPPLLVITGIREEVLCNWSNAQINLPEEKQCLESRDTPVSPRNRKRLEKQTLKPRPLEAAKETIQEATTSLAPFRGNTPTIASTISPSTHAASPASTIHSPPPEVLLATPSTPAWRKDPNLLIESDLPPPFQSKPSPLPTPSTYRDTASYLLATSFAPIPPPHAFIAPLTSHLPSLRSTETLLTLAQNTFQALKAWQDEYLTLDAKTAPHVQPPKKSATGGRVPLDEDAWEAAKEADAASWKRGLNPEVSGRNCTDMTKFAFNEYAVVGRGLRKRKFDAGLLQSLRESESDAVCGKEKRERKPVRRFDIGTNGESARKKRRTHEDNGKSPLKKAKGGVRRIEVLRYRQRTDFLSPTPEESGAGTDDNGYTTTSFQPWRGHTPGRHSHGKRANDPGGYRPASSIFDTSDGANTVKRRQHAKSEKRSESMTAWWAARKKKAAEEKTNGLKVQGRSSAEKDCHVLETKTCGLSAQTVATGLGTKTCV